MKRKVNLLIVALSLVMTGAYAQVTNEGTLKIESGTDMVVMTNYHNTSTGTHVNEGNFHAKADFINDGTITPASTGHTYFDSSSNTLQKLTGTNTAITFNNLTVNNTAASNDGVEVDSGFDLTVTNTLNMTSGKLRLKDDAMLIQTHTGATSNTGTSHLLIDQDGAKNAYRYNYWSSPVHDAAGTYRVQNVLMDGTTPNQFHPTLVDYLGGTNYEGDATSNPIKLSGFWFYKYIDGVINAYNEQDWIRLFDVSTNPPTASAGADINPAEGYIMKGPDAGASYSDRQNYTFEGIPNDGDYVVTISANKEYLVGNPYASALDADAFINDNISGTAVIDGTIYFWHHWSTNTHVYTEYGGGYATYNLSGTAAAATLHAHFVNSTDPTNPDPIVPKRYIPVGQGFVVRSATTSGGNIIFKNSQRAFVREGANSVQFGPDQAYLNENGVMSRVYLAYLNPTGGHRQITLAFTDGVATPGFDYGYDGIIPEEGDDDMFFRIDDNGMNFGYVIQGTGLYHEEDMFPLTIKVTNPGLHMIQLDARENFDHPTYIYDRVMNTTSKIDTDFPFEILLDSGVYENRFYLVFRTIEQMDTEQFDTDTFQVSAENDNIHLLNPENVRIDRIRVYDMLGKEVLKVSPNTDASTVEIPFYFGESTYVIMIEGEGKTINLKFINH